MTNFGRIVFSTCIAALSCSAQASQQVNPAAKPAATARPAAQPSPTPEEARAALNRAQAYAAEQQVAENVAREENHSEAVKARAAALASQQAAYAAALARYEAQKVQYEADLARWRASLPPCKPTRRRPCPAF
jgi:hypothetical protein